MLSIILFSIVVALLPVREVYGHEGMCPLGFLCLWIAYAEVVLRSDMAS